MDFETPYKRSIESSTWHEFMQVSDIETSVKNYADMQMQRTLEFYIQRIRQLGMKGKKVLDAGCGIGNWSIALSFFFDTTFAMEINRPRLELLNSFASKEGLPIYTMEGNITSLPFEDNSLDAVFCNGVIFITDTKKALAEFHRVLKPGGQLYATYNAKKWWLNLIKDPDKKAIGADAFLNEVFVRFDQLKIEEKISPWIKERAVSEIAAVLQHRSFSLKRILGRKKQADTLWDLIYDTDNNNPSASLRKARAIAYEAISQVIDKDNELHAFISLINQYGTSNHQRRMYRDIFSRILRNIPLYEINPVVYTFEPKEFVNLALNTGFEEIGTALEGLLIVDASLPAAAPIYDAAQDVWSTLVIKKKDLIELPSNPKLIKKLQRHQSQSIIANSLILKDDEKRLTETVREFTSNLDENLFYDQIITDIKNRSLRQNDGEFITLYKYLQDHLFHHPTLQLRGPKGWDLPDSMDILVSGLARCGHVAQVCVDLYGRLGFEARILQLHKHIAAEIKFQGKWRVVDPDLFKEGIIPFNENGDWPDLEELKADPDILDRYPALGIQLSSDLDVANNVNGDKLTGYVDTGLSWDRLRVSALYFDRGNLKFPKPPDCKVKYYTGYLHLDFNDISEEIEELEIRISSQSRGWQYSEPPDKKYLNSIESDLGLIILKRDEFHQKIKAEFRNQVVYINMFAKNNAACLDKSLFIWPSEEHMVICK